MILGTFMLRAENRQTGAKESGPIKLPPPRTEGKMSLEETLAKRRSVREYKPDPLTLADVAQLLWSAQGVTAPGGRRTAPSAGATYPLEVYLVAGNVTGLAPGIYRYRPGEHDLIRVAEGDRRARLADASLGQEWVEQAPITIAFAAVYERTSRRYGARAERYVHFEVGHAVENAHLQAVALGLGAVVIGAFSDAEVKRVLGLPQAEEPLCLLPVGKPAR
ncbi:MAG: SagB/ThcOx family dehydrogenase [Verrucomicrobiae bacterium]|nr:SagB/ThcOx family dehydrogenase [Verrucomicrobiae bacterium]